MTVPSLVPAASAARSPSYADIGHAVRLLQGEPAKRVRAMMTEIFERSGSSENTIDWSDPERWIDIGLSGELRTLARKVWDGSGKALNPRYFYASYLVVTRLKLLEQVDGIYRLSERGQRFLAGDQAILRELVTLRSPKRRSDRTPSDATHG